jgi:probable phosphoglycerate mutase
MREKEASTRIIYVRHGQTDFPLDRIYCDDRESPELNAAGLAQARGAADLLRDQRIDAIYVSSIRRARMTAAEISRVTGLDVVVRPDLQERRFGIWEGLYFHEIEQRYPEGYAAWKRDQAGYAPEGGETIYDLLARVKREIQAIVAQQAGKTVVVVSHVGPIRALLADGISVPLPMYRQLSIDYGSLSRMDYGKSQNNLRFMNVALRLP